METQYAPGPSVLSKLKILDESLNGCGPTYEAAGYFLRATIECIPNAVAICDNKGVFRIWNSEANELIKLGPKNISPGDWQKIYGLYLPDKKTPLNSPNALERVLKFDGEATDIFWVGALNQTIRCLARPVHDQCGKLVGAVVVFMEEEIDAKGSKT